MRAQILALAASAALAIVLGACGGSSSGTSTPAADTTGSGGAGAGAVATVTRTATATAPSSSAAAPSPPGTATIGSGGAPLAPGSGTSAAGGTPPCRAAGLVLSFLGQQGATGHGELGFALRNSGNSSCNTVGYPGVQFLDRSGGSLPTVPTHTTQDFFGVSPLRTLVVGAGQSVSFRLGVTHGLGSDAGCTTAYGLQVIAPNDTAALRVTIPDGGAAECGTATVSPVRSGDSAYP